VLQAEAQLDPATRIPLAVNVKFYISALVGMIIKQIMYFIVVVSSLNVYVENSYTDCSSTILSIVPFPVLGAFANLRKATINFVISVRPNGATRLPLNVFS